MSRQALTVSNSPQKVSSRAAHQKNKKSEDSKKELKASISGKLFKDMNGQDKDALLEILALQAGLIDPK